jgi:biopolymer transport protein ExbD/biopolymer transport protein TolR
MADIMLVSDHLYGGHAYVAEGRIGGRHPSTIRDMKDADKDDAIIVAVTRDGNIFLGNNKISKDDITGQIKDLIANRLDKTIYVKSDGRAKYGTVVAVVDEIRSAGVDQIGLLTEKTKSSSAAMPPDQKKP